MKASFRITVGDLVHDVDLLSVDSNAIAYAIRGRSAPYFATGEDVMSWARQAIYDELGRTQERYRVYRDAPE